MTIDHVPAGTNRQWRFHGDTIERVWAIGYVEGAGTVRCVIPPNDGGYRNVPIHDIVVDSDVLMGLRHHSPATRARFAALADGALASAQAQVRADDPALWERVAGRLA